MEAADATPVALDRETDLLAQLLLGEGVHGRDAAVSRIIEDLRRLEEEASFAGASRQTFQKIASARRLLGDKEPMSLKGPLYPAKLRWRQGEQSSCSTRILDVRSAPRA
ncbi:hypothetical protein [Methylorubrum extorquens]